MKYLQYAGIPENVPELAIFSSMITSGEIQKGSFCQSEQILGRFFRYSCITHGIIRDLPHAGINLIITAAKIVIITIKGNGMVTKSTSATIEKKEPSPRGEGLNQTERSILIKSTERHDKALRKLSKL